MAGPHHASAASPEEASASLDISTARQGPAAVARQLDRMLAFLGSLVDAAGDALAADEEEEREGQEGDEAKDGKHAGGEATKRPDGADSGAARGRRLQQDKSEGEELVEGGSTNTTRRGRAAFVVFTNIFRFFQSNGEARGRERGMRIVCRVACLKRGFKGHLAPPQPVAGRRAAGTWAAARMRVSGWGAAAAKACGEV